jgi:hypothetical protein
MGNVAITGNGNNAAFLQEAKWEVIEVLPAQSPLFVT